MAGLQSLESNLPYCPFLLTHYFNGKPFSGLTFNQMTFNQAYSDASRSVTT